MSYEVQFQVGTAEYTVRGPDIDGVLRLIQGVQGVGCVPEPNDTPWYPDNSGEWVEWPGGDCPVSKHTRVDILCESERALQSFHPQGFEADIYCWSAGATDRIVAYKVVKP